MQNNPTQFLNQIAADLLDKLENSQFCGAFLGKDIASQRRDLIQSALSAAEERGAERMRERAACLIDAQQDAAGHTSGLGNRIRNLPVRE